MFKIQRTTVAETKDGKTRLDIQLSDHKDIEQSSEYVVLSVVVDLPDAAFRFESVQARALHRANDLLDGVGHAIAEKISGSR